MRCCGAKPGLNLLRTPFHSSFLDSSQQLQEVFWKRRGLLECTCLNRIELGPIKLTIRSTEGALGVPYCGKCFEGRDTCSATS